MHTKTYPAPGLLFVALVARFGIVAGLANSVIARNVVFLCSRFGWQFNEFVEG